MPGVSSCMSKKIEMSILEYFFGLQIRQNEKGIFINQAKNLRDLLERFRFKDGKTKSTPISSVIKLDKDKKRKEVDIKIYGDMNL